MPFCVHPVPVLCTPSGCAVLAVPPEVDCVRSPDNDPFTRPPELVELDKQPDDVVYHPGADADLVRSDPETPLVRGG